MFEILFLGTSASAPSANRGLAGQIVSHNEYRFLVDCGEGTQRQILQSGIGFKRITRILLTHGHLDHILGLGGLLSTLLRWEAIDELEKYKIVRPVQKTAFDEAITFVFPKNKDAARITLLSLLSELAESGLYADNEFRQVILKALEEIEE